MNNEGLKKLVGYCQQVEQFGLGMEDEMKAMDLPEWVDIAKRIINIAADMTALKMAQVSIREVA
jgi:hypothetical protein